MDIEGNYSKAGVYDIKKTKDFLQVFFPAKPVVIVDTNLQHKAFSSRTELNILNISVIGACSDTQENAVLLKISNPNFLKASYKTLLSIKNILATPMQESFGIDDDSTQCKPLEYLVKKSN